MARRRVPRGGDDLKCPPLRFGHIQRKNYFNFRDSGASADAPLSHFHGWGRNGKRHFPRWFPAETFARGEIPPQSRCARQLPQGDAFRGGGKLSGISKSRPLGEGGLTRSGKTEGVLSGKSLCTLSPKLSRHLKKLTPRGIWHRAAMTERVRSPKSNKAVRHSPDGLAALIGKDRSGDGNCYFARPSFFSWFHARMTCTLVTRLPGVKAPSPMSDSNPASTAQRAALAVSGSATSL